MTAVAMCIQHTVLSTLVVAHRRYEEVLLNNLVGRLAILPCIGLEVGRRWAVKYGTVPVVRHAGGLHIVVAAHQSED